tara:strand:- start:9624 stop:9926 length:303 start_codon:yes stop_codon:yes gene_type:complete
MTPKNFATQIRYLDGYGDIVRLIGEDVTADALSCPMKLDRYAKAHYPHDAMAYEIFCWWPNEGEAGRWVCTTRHNRFQELAAVAALKHKFRKLDRGADRK